MTPDGTFGIKSPACRTLAPERGYVSKPFSLSAKCASPGGCFIGNEVSYETKNYLPFRKVVFHILYFSKAVRLPAYKPQISLAILRPASVAFTIFPMLVASPITCTGLPSFSSSAPSPFTLFEPMATITVSTPAITFVTLSCS